MEQRRMSVDDAVQVVSGFSMFLRDPSDHVLGQLLSLFDIEMVRQEPILRQTAAVSLASFFRMARIDRLTSETRFPAPTNGTRSKSSKPDGNDDIWPARLVGRFTDFLRPSEPGQGQRSNTFPTAGDRSAVLSALNILGHPSLIPAVLPLIEGKVTSVSL